MKLPTPACVRRILKILVSAVISFHVLAIALCVTAVAFPNIFKRYDKYNARLVADIPHESVVFKSRRGDELPGWFFRRPGSSRAVLLCHGRSRNKTHEMPYVRDFMKHYNVLVFDFAGHGETPYAATSIGYNEAADVLGAIDWLGNRGVAGIAVMGHSMGGVAAIKAVADYGDAGQVPIMAVVTEGAFANLDDLLHRQTSRLLVPPTVWWPAFRIAERLGSYKISDNVPERAIRDVHCPVLIMQADGDSLVPADSARRLGAKAGGPVEVVMFSGLHDVPCDLVSSNALRFIRVHMPPGL